MAHAGDRSPARISPIDLSSRFCASPASPLSGTAAFCGEGGDGAATVPALLLPPPPPAGPRPPLVQLVEDEEAAAEGAEGAAAAPPPPPLQADHALYALRAVIRHVGGSAQGGHYVADAQCGAAERGSTAAALTTTATAASPPAAAGGCGEGGWFHFDDSLVRPTSREAALRACRQDGYLFVYANAALPWGALPEAAATVAAAL